MYHSKPPASGGSIRPVRGQPLMMKCRVEPTGGWRGAMWRSTPSSNGTVELEVTVSGGLAFTQQNILNARSGSANQLTQVVNLDATEIGTVKVKWWPSFQRDVL